MLERRRPILTLGAVLSLAAVILLGLSFLGAHEAYHWDVQRCARLPDEWYPELGWVVFIGPLAFAGLMAGGATLWMEGSRRGAWVSWLVLGLCALLVGLATAMALVARFDPCPAVG